MSAATFETAGKAADFPPHGVHAPERRASWLELFFDLCFVVAVGAVAHTLHDAPSREGLIIFAALFVPVWWSWMEYAWYATSFPEGDVARRLPAFAAMLTILAMSAQIPRAAAGDPRGVVIAFAIFHLIVAALFLATTSAYPQRRPFALRYASGFALAATLWVLSLALPDQLRPMVWLIALLVDLYTPWYAVAAVPERVYDMDHIPERYGLFTIIVLGEAVIAVARGTAESNWGPPAVIAAVSGFAIAALVFTRYFAHPDTEMLARSRASAFIWGYGHIFVWAGIAMLGVGVEFAIEAATAGHGFPDGERMILCSGFALFAAALGILHAAAVGTIANGISAVRFGVAALALLLGLAGRSLAPDALIAILAVVAVSGSLFLARPGHREGAVG
ncbi:MAG: low temperature requirement protein A [Thermomicrobiales bacterium]